MTNHESSSKFILRRRASFFPCQIFIHQNEKCSQSKENIKHHFHTCSLFPFLHFFPTLFHYMAVSFPFMWGSVFSFRVCTTSTKRVKCTINLHNNSGSDGWWGAGWERVQKGEPPRQPKPKPWMAWKGQFVLWYIFFRYTFCCFFGFWNNQTRREHETQQPILQRNIDYCREKLLCCPKRFKWKKSSSENND